MRKLKLLMAACALMGTGLIQSVKAAAVDYLDGWMEVTSLPTSSSELARYYYAIVANEGDYMVGLGISSTNNSVSSAMYQTPADPTSDNTKVWMIEYSASYNYALRNLSAPTYLIQTEEGNPWFIKLKDQATQSEWTNLIFAYSDGTWTIKNGKYETFTESGNTHDCYWGCWHSGTYSDMAGNKSGADIGHFKIYRITRQKLPSSTDVTSTYLTNPDFEGTYVQKSALQAGQKDNRAFYEPEGWTLAVANVDQYDMTILKDGDLASNNFDGSYLPTSSDQKYMVRFKYFKSNEYLQLSQTHNITVAGTYTLSGELIREASSGLNVELIANGNSVSNSTDNTWETKSLDFTISEATDVTFIVKFSGKSGTGNNHKRGGANNISLTYTANYTTDLSKAIAYATQVNTSIENSTLATAINTAQSVLESADNTPTYQTTIEEAVTTLYNAVSTAISSSITSGDDVTYLLQNPSFEGEQTHYIKTKGGDSYYAKNWVNSSAFTSDSYSYSTTSTDYSSNGSKSYKVRFNWANSTYNISQEIPVTLPSGRYTLTADVRAVSENSSTEYAYLKGNNTSGTTITASTSSFSTVSVDADLDASGSLKVVLGMDYRFDTRSNTNNSAQGIYYWDNVTITYTSASEAYANAVSAATTIYNNTAYSNVTGTEKTALKTLIDQDASGFTVAEYFEGVTDIEDAVATFTAAKQSYDEYFYENQTATRLGTNVSEVTSVTSAETAETAAHEINVLNYANVEGESYSDISETVFGDWTDTNVNSAQKGQHWDGTGSTTYFEQKDGYSSSDPWTMSRTQTVQLPAGSYILKVAVRAKSTADATVSVAISGGSTYSTMSGHHGDSGKGITTSGVASYDEGTFANTSGRGWEWKYIPFTLDSENDVTFTFSASCTGIANSYIGFCNIAILTDALTEAKTELMLAISRATGITTAAINVGSGVFQIPTTAKNALESAIETAQGVYDDSSDADEVTTATGTLNTAVTTYNASELNTPADGKKYYIKVATTGHAKLNNAWVVSPGSISGNNPTGYTINASNTPASYLCQAFTFTQVRDNIYNISITLPEGEVYLTYGSLNGSAAGWNKQQIQATTNSANKGEFRIYAGNVDNTFKIFNIEDNNYIDSQDGGNIYTDTSIEKELFAVDEASQASVDLTISSENRFATRIFPFTPELPTGVEAYSCSAHENDLLTLTKVGTPAANTPYILYTKAGCSATLTGWGTAKQENYTVGYLTGVYESTTATAGTYVMQKNDGKVGFYQVQSGEEPTIGVYRAYMTIPSSLARAFFIGFDEGETTAIKTLDVLMNEKVNIYNANGVQIPSLQKGMNIIKGSDGKARKVMVK